MVAKPSYDGFAGVVSHLLEEIRGTTHRMTKTWSVACPISQTTNYFTMAASSSSGVSFFTVRGPSGFLTVRGVIKS